VYATPTHADVDVDFGGESKEAKHKDEKPLVLDSSVVRYTRFNSEATPTKIVDRLSEVLQASGGKFATKANFKVKAQFGKTSFVAQVFADPSSEKQMVVDFRKKTGTGESFRTVYQEIRAQLSDIVLQPQGKEAQPSKDETSESTS